MRGFRIGAVILAVFLLLSGACPGQAEDIWYLRVIGRDDTALGQAEKLRVRDAVWAACPDEPASLPLALPAVRAAAEAAAPCRVEIRMWSPDGRCAPAPALYVTVGPGLGHNWWGVLYQDAVLLARMEEEEEQEKPREDDKIILCWPLLDRLLKWLGSLGAGRAKSISNLRFLA